MKKLLLGLGSVVAVATPIVAVISCGDVSMRVTAPSTTNKTVTQVKAGLKIFEAGTNKMYAEFAKQIGISDPVTTPDNDADKALVSSVVITYPTDGTKVGYIEYTTTLTTIDHGDKSTLVLDCRGKFTFA